jgi:arylsulfatase A-like enzyme
MSKAIEMRRREFFLAAAGLPPSVSRGAQPAGRPNVLLIITDQQHIASIGACGNPHVRTPAMDHLCRGGFRFAQSHSTNPVCSPARSSIFTGRMPSETGVTSNGHPIRSTIPNLGQWLSAQAGYETFYAGKWHLPNSYATQIPGFRMLPGGIGGQGNLGDTCVSRACEAFLRNRSSNRPFLLVASFLQPHDICEWLRLNLRDPGKLPLPGIAAELPPLPPNFDVDPGEPAPLRRLRQQNEPARGRWSREHWRYYLWSYYRHVEMVDGEIQRVLDALHDTGRAENTLVVFTADHGEGLAEHQLVRKSNSYDAALKVPLVLCWRDHMPAGKSDPTSPVSGADIVPTVCDYAGVKPPPNMRGRSLRPLVEGKATAHDQFVVSEIPVDVARVVRSRRYKYVTFAADRTEQLFDMTADPGETRNLASDSAHAAALAEHKKLLLDWERRLDVAPGLPNANAWWRQTG